MMLLLLLLLPLPPLLLLLLLLPLPPLLLLLLRLLPLPPLLLLLLLLLLLPLSFAPRKDRESSFPPRRSRTSFLATSAMAMLVGAQASTRWPDSMRTSSRGTTVVVLPVPGGPCSSTTAGAVALLLPALARL
jgi:hypothetical protein